MALPNPFFSYLMSTAFVLWLEKMFSNHNSEIVVDKLRNMGWQYLTGGAYKTVYHKKGVPFLIKVVDGDYSNKNVAIGVERNALTEFEMPNMVNNLAYSAFGIARNTYGGQAWGIQERCLAILADFKGKFSEGRFTAIHKRFHSNPDGHIWNIGLTKCGRWLQFD